MPHVQYEPGAYWGRVTHHQLGKASTGTPQLIISFVVLGRINPADPDGDLLRTPQAERTMYRAVTENTIEYVKEDLRLLGFEGESLAEFDERNDVHYDLHGRELTFFCRHEQDQEGRVRERWSIARERAPLDAQPPDPNEIRRLDALFGFVQRPKRTPAPPTPPAAQPAQAEDVPF